MKSNDEKTSVLIIGYGNPLRGDDGLGCAVAELLERSFPRQKVRVINCHQLTPELAEPISQAALVIFIDACQNRAAGVLDCHSIEHAASDQKLNHHATPEQLLEWAGMFFGNRPLAYAITVGGENWGYSQRLSPKVQATIPRVINRVKKLVTVAIVNTEVNHA
jgi:hydrogenase maturation protease